jgi:hypothetical protein
MPKQFFPERPPLRPTIYAKYGLSPEKIAFIESMIRPMEKEEEK